MSDGERGPAIRVPRQQIQRVDDRLDELYRRHLSLYGDEVTAYYTPGVGYQKPMVVEPEHERFAICLATMDGQVRCAGDHDWPFALQSISKVFVYGMALEAHGRERVLARVGVEPTGDQFNSISVVFDERNNRPHNPMVNAGALVTTDLVRAGDTAGDLDRILGMLRRYAGNDDLTVDDDIFEREIATADRNRALSYLMRSFGMIGQDVEDNLAMYLRQCSVKVTASELALMAATLANGGVNPSTGEQALAPRYVRDVLSVMHSCGMYNFAGQWAYRVGIPAKSGVSGAIMAVVPGKLGIGVFSPGLDAHGNSVRGIKVCEEISARLGLHVFAGEAEDTIFGPPETTAPIPEGEE
jgi:glutaminase